MGLASFLSRLYSCNQLGKGLGGEMFYTQVTAMLWIDSCQNQITASIGTGIEYRYRRPWVSWYQVSAIGSTVGIVLSLPTAGQSQRMASTATLLYEQSCNWLNGAGQLISPMSRRALRTGPHKVTSALCERKPTLKVWKQEGWTTHLRCLLLLFMHNCWLY